MGVDISKNPPVVRCKMKLPQDYPSVTDTSPSWVLLIAAFMYIGN